MLAAELKEITGQEIRVTVPGHFQRGGSPCAYDRVLSTRFGAAAAQLICDENYGNMVALRQQKIVPVPLAEVAGKLKTVPVDCEEIQSARDIGRVWKIDIKRPWDGRKRPFQGLFLQRQERKICRISCSRAGIIKRVNLFCQAAYFNYRNDGPIWPRKEGRF